jgi:hypothetical protein
LENQLIAITVHVPDHRVEEFYVRFGEFVSDTPNPDAPTQLPSGIVPTWTQGEEALVLAKRLWQELSGPGEFLLHVMTINVQDETRYFTPDELAAAFGHPGGKSRVAGVLGGIGKAIRRAEIPIYSSPSGTPWHYIWDWDRERYSMNPQVAKLLRRAKNSRSAA